MPKAPTNRDEMVEIASNAICGNMPCIGSPCTACLSLGAEVLAALEAAGLRIVPVEPTREMVRADYYGNNDFECLSNAIAASPFAPEKTP